MLLKIKRWYPNHWQAVRIVSVVIILWSIVLISSAVWDIVDAAIHENFYTMSNLITLQQSISYVHGSLLMTTLFLGFQVIFTKKIKSWNIATAICCGFYLETYQFFDNVIHPLLFSLHMYDFLLREGQKILNPQYTKILFFFITTIILFYQCCRLRLRSVDKIFCLLILSVVLATTTIFHFAVPMGMFKMAKKELENNLVERIIFQRKELLCKDKHCFEINSDLVLKAKSVNSDMQIFENYKFIIPYAIQHFNHSNQKFYTKSLGNFQSQGFDYIIAAVEKNNNSYFVVFDTLAANKVSRHSEIWFSFLSVMAHSCWFYGGMFLLFLHKKIMFRKLVARV